MRKWAQKNYLTAALVSKIGAALMVAFVGGLFMAGEQALLTAIAVVIGGGMVIGGAYCVYIFSYAVIGAILTGEPIEKWRVEKEKEKRQKEKEILKRKIEEEIREERRKERDRYDGPIWREGKDE